MDRGIEMIEYFMILALYEELNISTILIRRHLELRLAQLSTYTEG